MLQGDQSPESMPLLRRGLVCFYCGSRSSQTPQGPVSQFRCDKCEAVNYLDENGEITDPPAVITSPFAAQTRPALQYAHQIARTASPVPPTDGSPFCTTCLKNQQFFTDALANYLPSPDDPSYAKYEAAYYDWRRTLEERYPQVCSDCLPRVRQKIKDTRYATITDDLRQKMLRSKHGAPVDLSQLWTVRGAVYILGGIAWWTSNVGQILWHVLGISVISSASDSPIAQTRTVVQCWRSMRDVHEISWFCFDMATALIKIPLALGFLSILWHRTIIKKFQKSGGRMVGQGNYLRFQIVNLTAKTALSWQLQEPGYLTPSAFRAAHTAALAFFVVATMISLFMVRVDYSPRFSFREFTPPTQPRPNAHQNLSPNQHETTPRVEPFPINKLTNASADDTFSVASAANSVADSLSTSDAGGENQMDSGYDEMDWTPTKKQPLPFQPGNRVVPSKGLASFSQAAMPGPSPFHGNLPAAPITPAHRARNPPKRPGFKTASTEKQENFFANMMQAQGKKAPDGAILDPAQPKTMEFELGAATFSLKEDPVETGLESIFDQVFTIRDDPPEVQAAMEQNARERFKLWALVKILALWSLPLLLLGLGAVYGWSEWWESRLDLAEPVRLPSDVHSEPLIGLDHYNEAESP